MKFIHISDLHFNPNNDGRTSRNIRAELIPYLQELNITADELLITDDYRHAGLQRKRTQADIDDVVNYIKDIAKAVNITEVTRIHLVPGNHDRSRGKGEAHRIAEIRSNYDPSKGVFDKDDLKFLLQKFNYFRRVCGTLYGVGNYWKPSVLHTYRVIDRTVFLYLNTAIMHNCDEDRKQHRLIIGNDYFDRLLIEIKKSIQNTRSSFLLITLLTTLRSMRKKPLKKFSGSIRKPFYIFVAMHIKRGNER